MTEYEYKKILDALRRKLDSADGWEMYRRKGSNYVDGYKDAILIAMSIVHTYNPKRRSDD